MFTIPGRLSLHERRLMVTLSSSEDRTMEIVRAWQKLLAIRELGSEGDRLSSLEGDPASNPGTPEPPLRWLAGHPPGAGVLKRSYGEGRPCGKQECSGR